MNWSVTLCILGAAAVLAAIILFAWVMAAADAFGWPRWPGLVSACLLVVASAFFFGGAAA